MKCNNCDKEFDPSIGDCPHCGAVPELDARQMSSAERDNYTGITIDPEQNQNNRQESPKVYFKKISFTSGILSTILLLVLIGLVIFVAMPIFAIIAIAAAVIWALSSLFF